MKRKQESIDLENGVEANLLEAILAEENIPHYIRTWNDLAYDGIYQLQKGWGIVETPAEYRDKVRELLAELRKTRDSAD